jgi:hypothetical protein
LLLELLFCFPETFVLLPFIVYRLPFNEKSCWISIGKNNIKLSKIKLIIQIKSTLSYRILNNFITREKFVFKPQYEATIKQ